MASPGALQSENYPVSSGFKIKVLPVKTQHLTSTSEKTTCPSNRFHWSWGSGLPFCARQSCRARAELVWQPTLPARLPAPPGLSSSPAFWGWCLPWLCSSPSPQATREPWLEPPTWREPCMGFPPHQAGLPSCASTREHPQRGSVSPSPRLPQLSSPGEGR